MTYSLMTFFVFILLVFLNLYYGLTIEKGNKKVAFRIGEKTLNVGSIMALFLMLFIIVIALNNKECPDYENYLLSYNINATTFEGGYTYLQSFARKINLSFDQYRNILIFLSYAFIWIGLGKLQINRNIVLAFYAVFPFSIDIIQFRNLFSFSIIFLMIPSLLNEGRKGTIKYLIAIALATTIHSLSIIYLLLLLVKYSGARKSKQRILTFAFAGSLLFLILCKTIPSLMSIMTNLLFSYTTSLKANHYTSESVRWGFVVFAVLELIYIFAIKNGKRALEITKNDRGIQLISSIYFINLAVACSFPLLLIHSEFFRIYRNLSLLNYSVIPLVYTSKKSNWKRACGLLFVLGFLLNWIWCMYTNSINVFTFIFKR